MPNPRNAPLPKTCQAPKASIFFQGADSDGNIKFKIWRVYPLQFASLEIEAQTERAQPDIRLAPFSLESEDEEGT
jgi:hypothetical protein